MGQTDRLKTVSCDPTSELLDNYIVLMYTMYNPIRKACLNQRYIHINRHIIVVLTQK